MDNQFFEKCKNELGIISTSAINANQTYLAFQQLRDLIKKEPELFDLSRSFYNMVMQNCIQVIFIELCKMFDYKKDSGGIRSLQNKIISNISLLDNNIQIDPVVFSNFQDSMGLCVNFNSLEEMITDSQSIRGLFCSP